MFIYWWLEINTYDDSNLDYLIYPYGIIATGLDHIPYTVQIKLNDKNKIIILRLIESMNDWYL